MVTTKQSRRIVIEPVTRVEGHGKVTILLDEEKQVKQARLHIVEFRGFERFVDGRQDGLSAMISSASEDLGMSFETARTLEVMKEFGLTGLAGANVSDPEELIEDPAFHEMMRTNEVAREMFLYLGGTKLRARIGDLLGRLDPRRLAGEC